MGETDFDSIGLGGTPIIATGAQLNKVAGADANAKVVYEQHNSLARTDTVDKALFTLPANAVPLVLRIIGAAVSNAGTTATISVGKTGTDTFFLNGFDVKGATGSGQQHPAAAANLGASVGGAAIQVVGIYAETGAASTAGGPWQVSLLYEV